MAMACTNTDRLAVTPEERAEQAEQALRRIVVARADTPGVPMPRLSERDRLVLSIACDGLEIDEPIWSGPGEVDQPCGAASPSPRSER